MMAVQSGILGMFARSPIRPLQRHMAQACACAELLPSFFAAAAAGDWDKAATIKDEISSHESQADTMKMDFRLHVPKRLFLPVPRTDLLELLGKQERIANIAEDIAGIMLGRKMQIPALLTEVMQQYLQRSVEAAQQAKTAISELDELLEAGFSGREVKLVDEMIKTLSAIESDTDVKQIAVRDVLFNMENELKPVDVMFLYKIIEWVGQLADCAQEAGERLKMLSAD
jgi:predicted phosphate transport protein (TIGR00153 family)